MAFH